MENSGNEMAYFIIALSSIVLISSFFIENLYFKKSK